MKPDSARLPFFNLVFVLLLFFTGNKVCSQSGFTIAFGSCSHQDDPDQMWADVMNQKPNLWMWIGDNIYGDTHNMDSLKAKYVMQKANPDYQKMLKSIPIIGTWDDHDYGMNDGGRYYSKKMESKELMLDFLDVPADAEVRKHEGVYQAYEYGLGNEKIKVILLDTRSFRDTLARSNDNGKRYVINEDGDVLGEGQWRWLEQELKSSSARLHIIASSIQFLSNDHVFEKWGNFPKARKRMLDLLEKIKPVNTLFVSGDRHMAEISKLKLDGLKYPLYDFTSSGLTHTWSVPWEESNALRVGQLIIQKNYGMVKVDWKKKGPVVTLQVKGKHNTLFSEEKIDFTKTR